MSRLRTLITLAAVLSVLVGGLGPAEAAPAASPPEDTTWNVIDSADTSPDQHNRLSAVDCAGPDDCWAVGFTSDCLEVSSDLPLPVSGAGLCNLHKTLIEHWDGTAWTIVPAPNPSPYSNQLHDITCIAADDCWAVGFYTGAGGAWTLALHWDGTSWSIVPSPNDAAPFLDGKMQAITCRSTDDCWAVGHGSIYITSDTIPRSGTLAFHWDGLTWSLVPTPNPNPDHSHRLYSVDCGPDGGCWAVGHTVDEQDHYRTLVMRWDEETWTRVESPNPSPTPRRLSGDQLTSVTCIATDECWATGPSAILGWDGTSWEAAPAPSGATAVTCSDPERCWGVAGGHTARGLGVLTWDGSTWKPGRGPGGPGYLGDVTCTESHCWAVGYYMPGAGGPRSSTYQTLIVGTLPVERGPGTHAQVDPPGGEAWISRYDGPIERADLGRDIVVSPDGTSVYVTGTSEGPDRRNDFATIAYDATTGAPRWLARFDRGADGADSPEAIAVSPDGTRVFVTGESQNQAGSSDFVTIAYDASDGTELWTTSFDGPDGANDAPRDVEVNPSGDRVYVTGVSDGGGAGDFATVAYDATDGAQIWGARYDGPEGRRDSPVALSIAPDGSSLFVLGISGTTSGGPYDFATVAYDARDGAQRWASRYNGPGNGFEIARDMEISPDGNRVFVAGDSLEGSDWNYATVAYDAAAGGELWAAHYDGPAADSDFLRALDVSPDGARVFVSGWSNNAAAAGQVTDGSMATAAYDATDGNEVWSARYDGFEGMSEGATDLRVAPDGRHIYVTGTSQGEDEVEDFLTLTYDVAGGEPEAHRYAAPSGGMDLPDALAISPTGARVFVVGSSQSEDRGLPGYFDLATVAYQIGPDPDPLPDISEVVFTDRNEVSGRFSDETLFEARLVNGDGEALTGATLNFELIGENSSRSFSATTDDDGVAVYRARLEERPGTYLLRASFAGDDAHAASSATIDYVVAKEDTATSVSVDGRGKNMIVTARLTDPDTGAGIEGRTIDFFSDGTAIGSAETNADGSASVSVPPRYRGGRRDFEAVFSGDDFYLASSATDQR